MQTTISVTESAKSYLLNQLAKQPGQLFRVSLKKTGCSGYSYLPALVTQVPATDTVITIDGLTIHLDTSWLHLLDGVQIDYIEEEKFGLKQKRLVFINQKEAGRCGCGESFHIE